MKNKRKDKVYCNRCKQLTNHDVIAYESQKFTPEDTPDMQIDFAEGTWEMLKCCGCGEVTFRETWVTSEDYNWNTQEFEPTVHVYPPRSKNKLAIERFYDIPPMLERIYQEIISCYNNRIYTLCAAGLRAIIEGICAANKIEDGPVEARDKDGTRKTVRKSNLQGKIEGMAETGLLTRKHAKVLHQLRFLGNEAVHELQKPSSKEVELAIEIVEHTLDNVYGLSDKEEELEWERKARTKRQSKQRRGEDETNG